MKIAIRGVVYSNLETDTNAGLTGYFRVDNITNTSCDLRYTDTKGTSYTISLSSEMLSEYEVLTVYYSTTNGLLPVKNTYSSRDSGAFYRDYYNVQPSPTASFAKGQEALALVLYGPTLLDQWTPIQNLPEKNMPNAELLDVMLPGFASVYGRKQLAKAELMRHISPLDSLSALEKQVDMLTEIIYNNINNIPQPTWATELFARVNEYSSTSNRDPSEILNEITTTKSKLRALQQEYFLALEGL